MRKSAIILSLILSATVAFGTIAGAAVPERLQSPVQIESSAGLTGSQAELEAALQEASEVTYKILVVDENPADRTAYLDQVLGEWGWPAANQLLLVIFPQANHDIRFAMGANFRRSDLTVDEMLRLVRSEYLSRSQHGDANGGLAALVRAVNKRMAPSGVSATQMKFDAMRQVVAYLAQNDAEALVGLIHPAGLYVAPYAIGLPDDPLSPEKARQALTTLVHEARPVIAGYNLASDDYISIVVRGIKPGISVPAVGRPGNTVATTDLAMLGLRLVGKEWRLSTVAFDPNGVLARRVESGPGFTKPGDWVGLPESERLTIARILLTQHLASYTGESIPENQRLQAFRIESVESFPALDDKYPLVMAIYSVRPVRLEMSNWVAGNGVTEGDWIIRKLHFLRIGFDGEKYVIQQRSTSP